MPKSRKQHLSKSNRKHSSSTKGRDKGPQCHKSQLKNLYCKDTRLYRKNPTVWLKACEEVSRCAGNLPTQEVIANRKIA